MRKCVFSCLSLAIVLFLFNAPLMGQEVKKDEKKKHSEKIKEEPDKKSGKDAPADKLKEIVVTASKTKQLDEFITKSLTVIGPEEIKSRKAENVSDLLRDVPGACVRQNGPTGSRTSLLLRGTHPTQTLVLLDGIVLNDPNLGGGFDLSDLDIANVERIEVLRGSQSTLYGSSAMGGVVNVIMKKGRGKPKLFSEAWLGSFDWARLQVGGSGGTEKSFWSFGAVTQSTSNDMDDNAHERFGLLGKFGVFLDKDRKFELLARIAGSESESPFDYTNPLTLDGNISRTRDQSVLGVKYSEKINDRVSYFLRGSMFNVDNLFRNKGDSPGDPDEFTSVSSAGVSTLGGQVMLDMARLFGQEKQKKHKFKCELIAGFEVKEITSLNMTESPFGAGLQFADTVTERALYLRNECTFNNAMTIILGSRLSKYGDYDSQYQTEIGLRYNIKSTKTAIKGNYGTGFRVPAPIEFFDPWVGNMGLRPEESRSYDIGIMQSCCEKKLSFGLTYFEMHINDLIAWDSGSGLLENLDKAKIKGIEFGLKWKPSKVFSLGLSYTSQEARDLSDDSQLSFRSPNFGGFSLVYKKEKLSLAMTGYFSEAIPDEQVLDEFGRHQPDAGKMKLVNFAGAYEVGKKSVLLLKITNLLNDKYKESQREPQGLPLGVFIGFKFTF